MLDLPGPRSRCLTRRPGVISVTLPSRHRPEMLTASVASLRECATRPELLEILIAHDPDDLETAQTAKALGADVVWAAPERYGYADLARYYVELINRATGEWCLPTWGDDALMQTQDWDEIVRTQPSCSVIYPRDNHPDWVCFPIVHMDVFCVLGRLCPLPATDSWYEYVARDAGMAVDVPEIYVLQDRFDLTGRNDDEIYRESRSGIRGGDFFSEPYIGWRAQDIETLQAHAAFRAEYQRRVDGPLTDVQADLPALRQLAARYPGARVAELGTRTGESTAALLAGVSLVGGHVWSVDCGPVTTPSWWPGTGYWSFSVSNDMSEAARVFVPEQVDVLFSDTSHYYQHTLDELELYVPRVRPGGVVAVHDSQITRSRIAEYEGVDPGGPDYPVAKALDDFCTRHGLSWVNSPGSVLATTNASIAGWGLGIIEIPGQ